MKKCPACNRTYTDDTLKFCLEDGSSLSAAYDPQATQRLPAVIRRKLLFQIGVRFRKPAKG